MILLCRDILARQPIHPERVLAHSDIAPLRKEDPGERFPWQRLHAAGIGHWVPAAPVSAGPMLKRGDRGGEVAELKRRFREYGYGLADSVEFDDELEAVVAAFQRHFRPALVDGLADRSTALTLDRLIAALPSRG